MKRTSIVLLTVIVSLGFTGIRAQIPNGSWRDHLPYLQGNRLAEYNGRIFCATLGGGLFSFDTRDNSIRKYSKVTGLSDADISTIGYGASANILVIGYKNGNIDLVSGDSVINIPDIKRKMISGEKSVNNIFFLNNQAYLACGFGIVLCDLSRHEIKDSYFFGPGGSQIFVNDITFDGQYLYAATAQGIYRAEYTNPNLVDFNAWHRMENLPDPGSEYRFLAWHDNHLFSIYRNAVSGYDEIITLSDSGWEVWPNNYNDAFNYLGEQHGYLVISSTLRTKVYGSQDQLIRDVLTYYANHSLYDSRQRLWYADPYSGMVRLDEAGNGEVIHPDGPAYRDAGDIEILGGELWAGGGTDNSKWSGYGAYSFIGEDWNSYNENTIPELAGFLNISEISIDPINHGHVIGGSFGYGIAEFQDGKLIDIIDETDGVLQPVPGYDHGYVRVTGTDFDQNGNLWICTSNSEQGVYRRKAGAALEPVQLDFDGFGFNTTTRELMVSTQGQVWITLENEGVLVLQESGGTTLRERFFIVRNQVPNLLDKVYAVAEDKEGDIWVGTNKGPVIYYNAAEVFDEEVLTGIQPEIPRNDGTSFVDLLLSTERINAIAVDGANQKWLATEKSGVFLVSPDGRKEIYHFSEENSPLFSNNVQTVAVNDKTGEVFFGTAKGIISFRGRATEGGDDFGNVYVFPNPVRENYQGDITVTGLVENVNVKITDISGNLVFETVALGGQAVWDGRNFRGERVQTGVYLVFCTNDDGSKTHVTKLLFIH
jgi:hypothetical protein